MSPWSNGRLSLLLLALGGLRLAGGVEQEAFIVDVTASKYDTRSNTEADEFKGCYEDGCEPALLIDGITNVVKQSRWSCETALVGSIEECYVTFDLGESLTLTKLVLYFRESNDTDRTPNDFIVSTSLTDVNYDVAFTGVNVLGTEIGVGEEFAFPNSSTGRYVRLQGDLEVDEWMSVNEAILYHEVDSTTPTPGPSGIMPNPTPDSSSITPTPTVGSSGIPTPSPTAEIYVDSDTPIATPTTAPTATAVTISPSAAGTYFGGEACTNITVTGAGELSGLFVTTVTASASLEVIYVSSTDNSTVMSEGEAQATCTNALTNCTSTMWTIASSDVAKYVVYDDAEHPSLIDEIWISIDDCSAGSCQNSPAELSVVCGDGSASLAPTPSPVTTDASVCGVVEVTGTSQEVIDGLYYDNGTSATSGVSQYSGFDADGTSNGNVVSAKSADGACSNSSSSAAATDGSSGCTFRQWWVTPSSGSSGTATAEASYFTYDEADHPADIVAGGLWYTSTDEVLPYDGEVVITCAPATTPTLSPSETGLSPVSSSSPSSGSRDVPTAGGEDDGTRAPVGNSSTPDSDTAGQTSDGGGSGGTGVIVGGVVGGVALLAILGAVAYKMKKTTPPPPPPSYDDLVGA